MHESMCAFVHVHQVNQIEAKHLDSIFNHMSKNKSGLLCAETFDKQSFQVDAKYKHLLGNVANRA